MASFVALCWPGGEGAKKEEVKKYKEEEDGRGEEPRRQNRREKEGFRMSKGTRVPFQTLSQSFSLKQTDVCAHGCSPHALLHPCVHADAWRERWRAHADCRGKKRKRLIHNREGGEKSADCHSAVVCYSRGGVSGGVRVAEGPA